MLSVYCNGSVLHWHISANADVELVITAFRKAYEKRNAPYGLMFHSDRGTQYTAFTFQQLLDSLNIVQSFSKKGYPFYYACCECFFKYLKCFLQALFGEKCKIFLENVASPNWRKLQSFGWL